MGRSVLVITLLAALGACAPKSGNVIDTDYTRIRDTPTVLRGTIGSRATLIGAEPVLCSGFGLVVDLNATGGGMIPEAIAAHMERELALMGVGDENVIQPGTALWNTPEGRPKTPSEILRDPNVGVVVVRAAIPPGAPEGATFDVEVSALLNGSVTSLEGGRLWTTRLQLGEATPFGGMRTRYIAQAGGPLFINPFKDPVAAPTETRRTARILGGGRITDPLELGLVLDTESHQTARLVTSAINSRFPPGPGDPGAIARGLGGRGSTNSLMTIALRVPADYADRPSEFIELVMHLKIDGAFPQDDARSYVLALKEQPYLADDISWALEAIGKPALPFIRELYDFPEDAPRLAGLRAGAHLNDPLATPALLAMATSGERAIRTEAIGLLGRLDRGPKIDEELRRLAASSDLDIRIAAYESLAQRAEREELRRILLQDQGMPGEGESGRFRAYIDLAHYRFNGSVIQGIRRVPVVSEDSREVKFVIDIIPYGDPMIYVTLQGQARIALFGENLTLQKPLVVTAWDNRLMIIADSYTDDIRLRYRDPATGRSTTTRADEDLLDLIQLLAFEQTPGYDIAGLDFSYSEVVGALSAIQESRGVDAAFVTEQDRLMAALLAASSTRTVTDRPETAGQAEHEYELPPLIATGDVERPTERKSLVVPIDREAKGAGDSGS